MGSLEAVKSVPVLNQVDGKIIKLAEDGKTIAQGDLIANWTPRRKRSGS